MPGSPPRVRGKGFNGVERGLNARITPACAGKRRSRRRLRSATRDHPRVCGEKGNLRAVCLHVKGSPPRVRGKAARPERLARAHRDHPRVCGEKAKKIPFNTPKTAFSSVLCQISFNFSYSMSVNVQSARARCVSLISIPKCRHKSCNV